jgi:hypothetical protein
LEDPTAIINPPTELKVGDKLYHLVFTHRALAAAEQATKLNLIRWLNSYEMSLSDLSGMLLACLKKHHPELTLDDVFTILDTVGIAPAFEAVVQAWKQAQPPPNAQAVAG